METGLLHCFIILLLSAAADPCANPATQTLTLRGAHSPVQIGAALRDLRLLRQAGQGQCEREGQRDTDIVVLVQQKNLIVSYSGWHIRYIWWSSALLNYVYGRGRRWERLSLTSCPLLLHCCRTKESFWEFIVSPFSLSESEWARLSSSESPWQFVGL